MQPKQANTHAGGINSSKHLFLQSNNRPILDFISSSPPPFLLTSNAAQHLVVQHDNITPPISSLLAAIYFISLESALCSLWTSRTLSIHPRLRPADRSRLRPNRQHLAWLSINARKRDISLSVSADMFDWCTAMDWETFVLNFAEWWWRVVWEVRSAKKKVVLAVVDESIGGREESIAALIRCDGRRMK